MSWQIRSRFHRISDPRVYYSGSGALKTNEECFIRKEHKCGKIFGASKSCFIACSSDVELELMLSLMSEKLTKNGIEPIIAVKKRAYGQDIFCTKICGRIIEAKFCIVILDDVIKDDKNIPNPNVYYEYGLMTSLKKHIIPLQKMGQELAFNIQSYDTIKYKPANLNTELDRAIRDAIKIVDSKDKIEEKGVLPEKTILRKFELAGFESRHSDWFLSEVIDDTGFRGFCNYTSECFLYLGKIDKDTDMDDYLDDMHIVVYRTEKMANNLFQLIEGKKALYKGLRENALGTRRLKSEIKDIESKLNLMSTFFIGFIINVRTDITSFVDRAEKLLKKYPRYNLVYNQNAELNFGDITIKLEFTT